MEHSFSQNRLHNIHVLFLWAVTSGDTGSSSAYVQICSGYSLLTSLLVVPSDVGWVVVVDSMASDVDEDVVELVDDLLVLGNVVDGSS